MTVVDPSQLDRTIAAMEKALGKGSIHPGNETEDVRRVPTGLMNLDSAMGGWPLQGFPMGRFSRLWGSWSSGKSLCAWNFISCAQKYPQVAEEIIVPLIDRAKSKAQVSHVDRLTEELETIKQRWPSGLNCILYNIEGTFDPVFVTKHGVDVSKLEIVEKTVIEEVGEAMESLLSVAHCHVVDSASAAVSLEEMNMDMGDRRYAPAARAWGQTLRKAQAHFNKDENIGVLIDQARTNLKTGAEMAAGGRFLDHVSAMTVHFTQGGWLFHDKNGVLTKPEKASGTTDKNAPSTGRKEADGVEIYARCEKNKVSRPLLSASMRLDHTGRGFDHIFELTNAAIYLGIVEQNGAYYKMPGGEKALHGLPALRKAIEADKDLQKIIRAELMASRNGIGAT